MELHVLRLFAEVARRGSFAEAARVFEMDPSSVSRAIAALEEELGSRLLQRSTRRVSLTEGGHLYLNRVASVIEELDHAKDELAAVAAGPHGTLRVTASVAFGKRCLVPLLPEFRSAYPKLGVELLLSDANLDLVAERIDLAVRLGTNLQVDAVGTKLMTTIYRVCVSPAYRDMCASEGLALESPSDLTRHRCLRFSLQDFRTRWLFKPLRDPDSAPQEVFVDGDIVISSALALHEATRLGMGPSLLPHWLVDEDIAAGYLVQVLGSYRVTATDFDAGAWLLYPSRSYLPNKTRLMIDFLKERFR